MSTELRRARTAFRCGLVALVVGALLAVYAAIGKPPAVLPVALVLVLVGLLAAVYGKRAEWAEKKARADRDWRAALGPLLRNWPLPKVRLAADVDFGVTRTRYTDGTNPYVPRAVDGQLRFALGARRFVLLRGESKAGKSRTLAEALRQAFPEAQLVLPRDAKAVAELSRLEPALPLEGAVVLLDDLVSADLDLLTASVLDFWAERAVLVGTITSANYEAALRTSSDVGAAARAALARATIIDLPFELTATELAAAREDYPDEVGITETTGIGEVLVGGEELVRKLRAGRRDSPAGQAVVQAAVDARRAGLRRPIAHPELLHLFPKYLERITVGVDATPELMFTGLEWGTRPVTSQVALLRRVRDSYEVLDFVVEAQTGALPDFLGPDLLALTTPADAYGIADAAYAAGDRDLARDGFRRALDDPDALPAAAFSLGVTLAEQDATDEAEQAYRRAIDTGHPTYAYLSTVNLGYLLLKRGALDEARTAFESATAARPIATGPRARVGLGEVHLAQDDLAQAENLFRQVIATDDPPTTALALHGLGRTLTAKGDSAAAHEIHLKAVHSPNPTVAAWARAALDAPNA
ncbi:MAG: tetratricopeptide repeat protein [Umezawaea sp.]